VSCVNLQTDIIEPRSGGIHDVKWRAGWFYQATVAEWDYRVPLFAIKICFRWRQHFDHFYLLVSQLLIRTHGGYAARAKEQTHPHSSTRRLFRGLFVILVREENKRYTKSDKTPMIETHLLRSIMGAFHLMTEVDTRIILSPLFIECHKRIEQCSCEKRKWKAPNVVR